MSHRPHQELKCETVPDHNNRIRRDALNTVLSPAEDIELCFVRSFDSVDFTLSFSWEEGEESGTHFTCVTWLVYIKCCHWFMAGFGNRELENLVSEGPGLVSVVSTTLFTS